MAQPSRRRPPGGPPDRVSGFGSQRAKKGAPFPERKPPTMTAIARPAPADTP
jgi:hypothetical protein